MNRKQYFVISWFFLALMIILIYFHTTSWIGPGFGTSDSEIVMSSMYHTLKFAIISVIITLCFPLFVLFQILGWLEPKKQHQN